MALKPCSTSLQNFLQNKVGQGPTLQHFILRAQALSMYRTILRTLRHIDKRNANELREWARHDFERTRNETDIEKIKYYLSLGNTEITNFKRSLALAQPELELSQPKTKRC
ncbi:uncharacterized protein VTP21DRAFT_11510 [Calcarisporiella thermophila]|uniref:uncharacterized protein n=1 Tax=Calcarisporiella thermophila TaxID=911321 RepID=UPI003742DDCC